MSAIPPTLAADIATAILDLESVRTEQNRDNIVWAQYVLTACKKLLEEIKVICENLQPQIATAFHDIRSFECSKNLHMKEEAQFHIFHALLDCSKFTESFLIKE